MRNNCLGFLILYCCVFTWLAASFMTVDDSWLAQPELLPVNRAEAIMPKETVTAAIDMRDVQDKLMDDVRNVSVE